jgi:hypothetical protein
MRTTLNISEDAFLLAQSFAKRQQLSIGEAVSRLIRESAAPITSLVPNTPLRGRFALAPRRGEVITSEHVRELMEREGI